MSYGEVILLVDTGPKCKPIKARQEWTVQRLYDEVAKMMTTDGNFHLIAHGSPLVPTAYVSDYHFQHNDRITCCQQVRVGSRSAWLSAFGAYGLAGTRQPCYFTGVDDPSEMRARMPCGCAIAADAMKSMSKATLDRGESGFHCPNCRTKWEVHSVRGVLSTVMSQNELNTFDKRVDTNYMNKPEVDIRQCFQCGSYCFRDASRPIRVICKNCTQQQGRTYEFCWLCTRQWRGNDKCGNANCDSSPAERVKILAGCATKAIAGVTGCPEKRGCLRCGALIEHAAACKHIKCGCGYQFCFVCLKPMDSKGQWQCGSYNDPCSIAPRQTYLPM